MRIKITDDEIVIKRGKNDTDWRLVNDHVRILGDVFKIKKEGGVIVLPDESENE